MLRSIGFVSTSLIALVAGTSAWAQTTAPDNSNRLSEIVVTATKQATNVQKTPIAITAVTADTLEKRGITNSADLGALVPNATFREAQGAFGPGVTAFIRGIGQGDTSLASEPGVAYYIDDVYYPLILGSMFDLLDLDHVEVLRGPQGTLFGRNALAGAINLVSKAPSTTKASGYAEITGGSFDEFNLRAGVNLPLADNLAIRLSGVSKTQTGYQDILDFRCQMIRNGTPQLAGNFPFSNGSLINTAASTPKNCVIGHLGGTDTRAMVGQLLWEPTSRLKITFGGDWTQDNSESVADQLIAVNATTANNNANLKAVANAFTAPGGPAFAYDSRFVTGNPYTTYATRNDPIAAGAVIPGSTFYNGSVVRGGQRNSNISPTTNWGLSTKGVYTVTDTMDLTLIGGYRSFNTVYSFDVDGSPLPLENTLNNSGERDWTGEARLSKKGSWYNWVAGVFYYAGDGYVNAVVSSPYNNLLRVQSNRYTPDSKAAYANVNIEPTSKLTVNLGVRYSDDKKVVNYSNLQDATPSGNIIFNVTPADSRWDWKAGLNYQLTDATMVYTSAATGFRLPSFNARPLQPDQVSAIPGDQILSYELGVKSDLFDRRVRLAADVFYTDYQTRPSSVSGQEYLIGANGLPTPGAQITTPLPSGGPNATTCRALTAAEIAANTPGFQCIGTTYYTNTPGKVKGVEAEIEARPIDHMTLNASMGYSKFDSADLDAATRVNHSLLGVPDWTANAGAEYVFDAPALKGTITPRLDWFYTGSEVYSAISTAYNQPAYSVVNGRLTYFNQDRDMSVALSVSNLLNTFYYRNFFIYSELGYPNVNGQPSPPREWSVTIRKTF
jgi:iron complex outermembrane receptor protein